MLGTISEWILAVCFQIYILSFAIELRNAYCHAPKLKLVAFYDKDAETGKAITKAVRAFQCQLSEKTGVQFEINSLGSPKHEQNVFSIDNNKLNESNDVTIQSIYISCTNAQPPKYNNEKRTSLLFQLPEVTNNTIKKLRKLSINQNNKEYIKSIQERRPSDESEKYRKETIDLVTNEFSDINLYDEFDRNK